MHLALYILHMLALAGIVIGFVLHHNSNAQGQTVMTWSARLQLLVGLGLVGLAESQGAELNHMWVAVKLLVALAVVACLEIASAKARKGEPRPTLLNAAFALTLLNAAVAWLWH
ncbi:MAG: hypothetical protein LWW86_14735 [Micrococcales bacterium]|nr:hypothetical protein [Micrococcales bacterium]